MKRHEILFLQGNIDKLPPVEDLEFNLILLENKELLDKAADSYRKVLQDSVSPFYMECLEKLADCTENVEEVLGDDYAQYSVEHHDFLIKQAEFLSVDEDIKLKHIDVSKLPDPLKKVNLQQTAILKYFI